MRICRVAVGIPVGTPHRPHRTEQGALHHSAPSSSPPQRYGIEIVSVSHLLRALYSLFGARSSRAALRVEQQTHQGVEPYPRLRTRSLCETNKSRCHGHSPLSVGPCIPYSLSQADTPLLGPHYQTSSLLWVSPTSDSHFPLPRFLHLSEGAHSLCADSRISLVTA